MASGVGVFAPRAIAVDDTFVYYFDAGVSGTGAGRGLVRVDKVTLARTQVTAGIAPSIAADNAFFYWSGSHGVLTGTFRMPKGGGPIVHLYAQDGSLLVDDKNIYWNRAGYWRGPKDGSAPPVQLTTRTSIATTQDATKLYGFTITGASNQGWSIWSVDKTSGAVGTIDDKPNGGALRPLAIAAHPASNGVAITTTANSMSRIDGAWAGPPSVGASALASDGCNVYAKMDSRSLRILPKSSGIGLRYPFPALAGQAMAFDDTYVYVADGTSVRRALK